MRWGGLTVCLCIAAAFYVFLTHMDSFNSAISSFVGLFSTVVYGAVIAYIVNPLATFFDKHLSKKMKKASWTISAIAALVIVLAAIIGFLIALIPQLVSNIQNFAGKLDDYIVQLNNLIRSSTLDAEVQNQLITFIEENSNFTAQISNYLTNNVSSVVSVSTAIGGGFMNSVISIIFAFYFLIEKQYLATNLGKFFYLAIPDKYYKRTYKIWKKFNSIFSRYIVCVLIDAIIIGVSNALFMMITGMPYVMLISVVVGVTNIAPTFGPIVGGVFGALILILAEPKWVIPFVIFTIILQTIDGYVIKPKMYGSALNVPSFLILIFLVVGGKLWGVPGLLLAIPLAAILSYMYTDIAIPLLAAHKRHKRREREKEKNAKAAAK